ncbi:MAG: hypothetical protein BroJett011_62720 [Chloroflexota bacterium]|nr:MAG: hypothetical protein BroJett011_62720 [Chloroflexota bacterium]
MTDLTVTAAQVGVVDPAKAVIKTYIAAAAITAGQAIYQNTSGKADLADANGSGTLQFRGVALKTVGAGDAVDVCEDGEVYGFDLSGLNYDALVYLSNTAGALADGAGGTSVVCGRVNALTDNPTLTKVLRVFVRRSADWA